MANDNAGSWFALRVKPNCEKVVAQSLLGKGYEGFLPVYRLKRRWSNRQKIVELPLFPGYLFCRFDVLRRMPILMTPGILHIVGVGSIPEPVSDEEIESLKTVVDSPLNLQPWPFLAAGDRVQIQGGPLRGARGVVLASDAKDKLVVSISLLQRSVAVEIERSWLEPASTEEGYRCLQSCN
jgi:transcription antitermination factor NusG